MSANLPGRKAKLARCLLLPAKAEAATPSMCLRSACVEGRTFADHRHIGTRIGGLIGFASNVIHYFRRNIYEQISAKTIVMG